MEVKQDSKKCDICKLEATCLCHKSMCYFCDSCFKYVHSKDANKNHTKENIDYYIPFDLKCPEHNLHVMDLFCVDEKGKYTYNYINYSKIFYYRIMLFFMLFL